MYLGKQNYRMVNMATQLPHNYISTVNPTVDVNPPVVNMTWLNTTTSEIFVCSDNTTGANIWIGQLGTLVPPSYSDIVLQDLPVNYWKLDEASGALVDVMAEHTLSWSAGTPSYGEIGIPGGDGTAIHFNGSEYAEKSVTTYRSLDHAGTIEAWVKLGAGDIGGCVFVSATTGSSSYGVRLVFYSNLIDFGAKTTSWENGTAAIAAAQDQWHHVCMTSDGSTWRCYFDGAEVTFTMESGSNTGRWFADVGSRNNLALGAWVKNTVVVPFEGFVDEVAVYNFALSSQQILNHYNKGIGV